MAEFEGRGAGIAGAMPVEAVAVDAMCKVQDAVDRMRIATNETRDAQEETNGLLADVRNATARMDADLDDVIAGIRQTNALLERLANAVEDGLAESQLLRDEITRHRTQVREDMDDRARLHRGG